MHSRHYHILNWIYYRFGTDLRQLFAKKVQPRYHRQSKGTKKDNLLIEANTYLFKEATNSRDNSIVAPTYLSTFTIRAISTSVSSRRTTTTNLRDEENSFTRGYHRATKTSLNALIKDEEEHDYDFEKAPTATRNASENADTTNNDNSDHNSAISDTTTPDLEAGEKTPCIHAIKYQQQLNQLEQQRLEKEQSQTHEQSQRQDHEHHHQQSKQQEDKHQGAKAAEQKLQAKSFDSIPGPKPSLPFIGTNWIYFPVVGHYQSMKLHEANMDKYHRYGPIMKEEYQRGHPTVTIFHPSDIKEVFVREGACPSRPVLPYVIKHRKSDPSRYPNVGLANMEGPEWLELRSRLAPLLLSRELKERHISTQNRVSSRLVNYIKSLLPAIDSDSSDKYIPNEDSDNEVDTNINDNNSGIVDNIQEVFYRFSMESIMNLCINQELGCLKATGGDSFNAISGDGELIFQAAMNFFEAQHKLYYGSGLWKYIDSKPYRQLRDSQNAIHDIASKYIDVALVHLKKKRESNLSKFNREEEHESLLETLYCTNRFNDLEIKSTIVDFVGGGIYTVANTLTMVLFLLASNPHVQEQLYQEICQVFGDDDNSDIDIDTEKLEQLKFLKLCLKESYRLLPTIPGVARTLNRDMVLSNYLVPKNTLVFCNFMVTCRLPQYFSNPDDFNPNRWERNGKHRDSDLAFCLLPFGHGVRKCIGHNFAELEIYVALAKLIRHFKIDTINGENAKSLNLCYKFIVVPENPVTLEFTPRNQRQQSQTVDNQRLRAAC